MYVQIMINKCLHGLSNCSWSKIITQSFTLILIMMTLPGCAGWETRPATGAREAYYFGLTRVEYPPQAGSAADFEVKKVSNVGLGLGAVTGLTVGYTDAKVAKVPQTERGSAYIRVANQTQFEALQPLIEKLQQEHFDLFISQAPAAGEPSRVEAAPSVPASAGDVKK
jgi:hypothetical protein